MPANKFNLAVAILKSGATLARIWSVYWCGCAYYNNLALLNLLLSVVADLWTAFLVLNYLFLWLVVLQRGWFQLAKLLLKLQVFQVGLMPPSLPLEQDPLICYLLPGTLQYLTFVSIHEFKEGQLDVHPSHILYIKRLRAYSYLPYSCSSLAARYACKLGIPLLKRCM